MMSYSDMRKFVVTMRTLGYPRAISMDSFRSPNFELVADCLHWLVSRYDNTAELETDISTEQKRVAFLKSATQLMLSKGRIKLNPRRLYSADGVAVKELLKIASVLAEAMTIASEQENEPVRTEQFPTIKVSETKATRALVNEITKCGAAFYDCLAEEPELYEARWVAANLNTDMDEIEKSVVDATNALKENIAAVEEELVGLENDEKTLQAQYEKRKLELERSEKRLSTLENVRPSYMDEYEALEKQLKGLFAAYLEKHRNLQWLEAQMEIHSREEQEKVEEAQRKMRRLQRRMQNEEVRILRGEEVPEKAMFKPEGSEDESESEAEAGTEAEGSTFWNWFRGGTTSLKGTGSGSSKAMFKIDVSSKGGSLGGSRKTSSHNMGEPRADAIASELSSRLEKSEERLARGIMSIQASLNHSERETPSPALEADDSDLLEMDGGDNQDLQDNSSDDNF